MSIPTWLVALAVIPPFLIFAWYLVHARRDSRYLMLALLVALVYGMAIESLALHTTHDYDYADLWLMFGAPPDWVPYTIGVCWACLFYVVGRTSDALGLPWWQRPFFDGALAMTIDLMLDPVMSATRFTPNTVLPCMQETGPLSGGLELWVWCVPPDDPTPLFFSVPTANFLGWFTVITMLSFTVRAGRQWGKGETRGALHQAAMLVGLGVLAIGMDALVGQLSRIPGSSGPAAEWTALAVVVALPWLLILTQRRHLRFDTPFSWGRVAWPAYAYASWGVLFYAMGIAGASGLAGTLLMTAVIAEGILLLLMPSLGTFRRRA